ncbi:UDP-glucose 4-epimerase [Vibrio splendidus]|nr:UDP-glucose 4-epimerase [Vibrio splendidus]
MLLTGASGFIGSYVINEKTDVKCVVRNGQKHSYDNFFSVDSFDGDTNWEGAFDNIDCIIHLAGIAHKKKCDPQDYIDVNYNGTVKLAVEAAKAGVKRFVFVSSVGVNGSQTFEVPFRYDSLPQPQNDYTKSKYEAELTLKKIVADTKLEIVIVRPTLVYGPNALGNFGSLVKIIDKLSVLPFGLINNRRDFIAIQNLVDLLFICTSHPKAAGQTFIVSDGETVSTKTFTNAIAKGLGKKVYQLPVPVSLMRFAGKLLGKSAMIEQLVGNLQVDSSDLRKVLGWTPPYTMEESMALLKEQSKERE